MGSQQFCLKWNNHQSNMLAVFEQLLSNEALVDVTLACEGLSLKAHKMVLSACSPFFQALFVENPCKHPIVIMKDMRYVDLKAIVEFMYRGEVNVSQDQLSALLKTAETLKVKGLAEVTGENKHGALVSVDGADPKPVGTPRAESPPLSKRKRGRPRRRSPSDSNKSDSEDQGGPPATRIKGPESPEIIEDGSMSSDRVTALPAASPSSRTSSTVAVSSTAVPSGAHIGSTAKATNSLATSQHTQDSIGDDVGEGDDADFEVEPSNLMEQSMTTENVGVPVFTDVASSSQALGNESQQSHHTGSTSDSTALVPVQASLPSDISISSQVDVKPSPSSLIPFDDQAISPVVAAPPAAAASSAEGANMAMMFMDTSGVPAIAGPSNYHPDKQQSTPSHVPPRLRFTATSGVVRWLRLYRAFRNVAIVLDSKARASLKTPSHLFSVLCEFLIGVFANRVTRPTTANFGAPIVPVFGVLLATSLNGSLESSLRFFSRAYLLPFTPESTRAALDFDLKPKLSALANPSRPEQIASNVPAVSQFFWRPRKKTGTFRCDVCGKPFSNKANMQRHKVLHATVRDVYFCDVCSRPFSWKSSLERHKRDMHAALAGGSGVQRNDSSRHTSLKPLAAFMDQAAATAAAAAGTAEARPTCDICGRRFFNKQTLERHMDRHRPVRQSYECEVCHKTYAFVTGLYHHRKTHGSIARFKCNFCGEHFMYSRSLYKHVNWDMFTSSLASLVSGDSSNDGTVEMVQTEERLGPAECPICHKVLCNYFIMKRHMVLHDQNRLAYECALCVPVPRRRGRPPLLGKRGQPVDLECPICHKTFSNKSNYDGHLTMHTPQRKRYRCDICNKSFLWRNNVYAHKRKIHNVPSSRGAKNPGLKPAMVVPTSDSQNWSTMMRSSMLPPAGFSASPSLLLLQAASAAWNDSREAQEK
ncbi:hypothetical protein HPB50_013160 [Hyalomma asiaticum]|uniref:Uncharacterized protein n=1 Tax=Hyalomma asiaticum TaxID=266040 RepID=A0ACB7SUD1_HYAAI|nr:hypothetical protein HPB50_013160 [Hyalomma asiaticum]